MTAVQALLSASIIFICIPLALANTPPAAPESEQAPAASVLGTEQSIDGFYSGNCLDERNGDLCWQRIVRQAETDLRASLLEESTMSEAFELRYVDFEGRQKDTYQNNRLEMSADGRFYFDVIAPTDVADKTSMSIHRARPEPSASGVIQTEPEEARKPSTTKEPDPFDFTLFYVWDGNDSALQNDMALSSNRWGLGVWANNRIGLVAFQGTDTIGFGHSDGEVKNTPNHYQTTGIGIGFRLWDSRGINIENTVYYVDAKPYLASITPSNCSSCSAIEFESEDYLQATLNIKTNSRGVNLGWMFTWKALENTPNIDALSSGIYIEAQF